MKKKRIIFNSILIILIISTFRCYDDEDNKCDHRPVDCVTERHTEGWITIEVTINSQNPSVTIKIYRGNFEDDNLVASVDVSTDEYSRKLPLGEYSAVVDYKCDEYTITAVDGDEISSESEDYCEGSCYELSNAELDCKFDEEAFRNRTEGAGEQCFIATAVYGPDSEEVRLLRGFRDRYLISNIVGRFFVKAYCKYSPPLAKLSSEYKSIKYIAQGVIAPVLFVIKYPYSLLILLFAVIITANVMYKRRKA